MSNASTQLLFYSDKFQHLQVNKQQGQTAPHKAILLISILELVAEGLIRSSKIYLTSILENRFEENWIKLVGSKSVFNPIVGTPFFHLHSEGFWKLVPHEGGDDTLQMMREKRLTTTSGVKKRIHYALLDEDLFQLMLNTTHNAHLHQLLMNYF